MEYEVEHASSCVSPGARSSELVFKCCECHEEHSSIERLEFHLWACHLRTFPFNCSLCSYPALTVKALKDHFGESHPNVAESAIEFKRRLDLESRLRSLLSQSIHLALLRCESVYEDPRMAPNQNLLVGQMGPSSVQVAGNEVLVDELVEEYEDEEGDQPANRFVYEIAHPFDYYGVPDNEFFEEMHEVEPSGSALPDRSISFEEVEASTSGSKAAKLLHMVDNSAVQLAAQKGPRRASRTATYYKCEHCDKIIRYPSKIKEHQRSHTGERPFQCHICQLSFSQRGALKCHIRLHTGEKPFKCTWECGKSFVSSSARLLHEKAHTGEKPFVCQFCNHRFGTKYHLNRHLNTRHSAIVHKPTGLDAAGDGAPLLEGLVTSVIEDVRRKKKG